MSRISSNENLFGRRYESRMPPIAFLILCLLLASCSSESGETQAIAAYEGGRLYQSPQCAFYIAALDGTFYEMGRQYGYLLQDEINDFYQTAYVDFIMGQRGATYQDLAAFGRAYYSELPLIFRDYVDGMAETNGLGRDETYMVSSGLMGLFPNAGCSSLSAWGPYTVEGTTITGRNLDLPTENLRRFSKYVHVTVMNATELPASVANIGYIGGLFFQTAINSSGIFLELQNGEAADTAHPEGGDFVNHRLLESLFINTNSHDVDQWFNAETTDVGLIMNASFPGHATIYEWSTFRVAARNAYGLISATNDYIDPSWRDYPQINWFDESNEGIGYTVTRRKNLLALGESAKGTITPEKMMEIFDTTIPQGGATFPEGGIVKTIYSVVVKPSDLKIWLKVHEYSDWEQIDLHQYFH
jgi:hypothetical protein